MGSAIPCLRAWVPSGRFGVGFGWVWLGLVGFQGFSGKLLVWGVFYPLKIGLAHAARRSGVRQLPLSCCCCGVNSSFLLTPG